MNTISEYIQKRKVTLQTFHRISFNFLPTYFWKMTMMQERLYYQPVNALWVSFAATM